MTNLIRKHQKKAMALFAVILMISFVATTGYGRGNVGRGAGVTVATAGGKPVYATDLEATRREISMIRSNLGISMYGQSISLGDIIFPRGVFQQMKDQPETFYLLAQEARDASVQPSLQEVQAALSQFLHRPTSPDDAFDEFAEKTVTDLLAIRQNFTRAANVVKVSQPMVQRSLAEQQQKLTASLVELNADSYFGKTPAPTTQQVADQFKQFSNVKPGQPDSSNPFGFGYLQPARVKLQYIEIPRGEVDRAVQATKDAYSWDVEAHLFYNRNPEMFRPRADANSTTQPAIPEYKDVAERAHFLSRQGAVNTLMREVQNKVVSTLTGDWIAYRRGSGSTTQPTVAPVSSLGVPYGSFLYLSKLQDLIRAQFNVNLAILQLPMDSDRNYISVADLGKDVGIGQARWGGVGLSEYVADHTRPLAGDSQKNSSQVFDFLQPSPPSDGQSREEGGSIFIFRITDARPSEAPSDISLVADKITNDLREQAAYEQAKTIASQLVASANSSDLSKAAQAAGLSAITMPAFSTTLHPPVPGIDKDKADSSARFFNDATEQLLSKYDPVRQPHPTALIEVPTLGRVYALQLQTITSAWTDTDSPGLSLLKSSLDAEAQWHQELGTSFALRWFAPDSIKARQHYLAKSAGE